MTGYRVLSRRVDWRPRALARFGDNLIAYQYIYIYISIYLIIDIYIDIYIIDVRFIIDIGCWRYF